MPKENVEVTWYFYKRRRLTVVLFTGYSRFWNHRRKYVCVIRVIDSCGPARPPKSAVIQNLGSVHECNKRVVLGLLWEKVRKKQIFIQHIFICGYYVVEYQLFYGWNFNGMILSKRFRITYIQISRKSLDSPTVLYGKTSSRKIRRKPHYVSRPRLSGDRSHHNSELASRIAKQVSACISH